jgi:broad specificity phosphatase PhoE
VKLYIIRHAQTEYNANHLAQGHSDVSLNTLGLIQAKKIAEALDDVGIGRILSSDLSRCVQTAQPLSVATSVSVHTNILLRERNFGNLEGQPMSTVRAEYERQILLTGKSAFEVSPGDAESAVHVYDRMQSVQKIIEETPVDTAIVTHGMTKEVLLCSLIGAPVEVSRSFEFKNASITRLSAQLIGSDRVWVIEELGSISHLA